MFSSQSPLVPEPPISFCSAKGAKRFVRVVGSCAQSCPLGVASVRFIVIQELAHDTHGIARGELLIHFHLRLQLQDSSLSVNDIAHLNVIMRCTYLCAKAQPHQYDLRSPEDHGVTPHCDLQRLQNCNPTLNERSCSCNAKWTATGNSPTSNTSNTVASNNGIPSSFIHQHTLQAHVQCKNALTVSNQDGLLSTHMCQKPIHNAERIQE